MSSNKHGLATPPLSARSVGLVVLVVGGVLGVAAAFGPLWVIRAGIAVAVLAGAIAFILVWRQVTRVQRAREDDRAAALHKQAEAMSEQRQQHTEVLETLNTRQDALRAQLRELRIAHADRLIELNTLRGDKTALQADIDRAAAEVASLRERVAELEEKLAIEDGHAEVFSLPRRLSSSDMPGVSEEDLMPTVIDLQALALPLVEEVQRDHG